MAAERATRVLIVDDNRDVADGLAAILRILGCTVRVVYFSTQAVKEALDFLPDCIISDITMPGIDGYELAMRLRSEQMFQRVPIYAHTAIRNDTKAKEAGFDHVLLKPVTAAQLRELLTEVRTMEERLDNVEKTTKQHGEIVHEVKDLLKEVGADVKEMKGNLQGDVKELKQGLQEVKEDVKEIKHDLREVQKKQDATDERS
jgi:CheY-like chemotaxis protein